MMGRFKGLDLVDRVPEEQWTAIQSTVQEAVTKTIPKKKKYKKAKWLSEKALQVAKGRREGKSKQGEKRKIKLNGMQSSREQQGEIRRPS